MKETKPTPMNLDFSIKVTATDFPKREISGRIVTWNEEGSTSAGSTMFKPGSITFSDTTKLLLEHRRESPIGFLKSYDEDEEGIYATFSIGKTTAGSDALEEAFTGLRDGFSVGVLAEKYKNVDGVLVISASALKEVSLVTEPAIGRFTTNPAFSPVSYVRDVATNTNADRPVIEACGGTRPLSTYGMTVSIPKITANSTAATVAEGGDPTGTTAITSAYVNATVIKKMGFQRYSVELLDRSDPSFYEIMLANLRDAYAQATDQYVIAQITAGGTQATATAADSAGIISFVSTESPAVYNATKRTATAFVSGTSIWSTLLSATDTTGRPIYNAQPMQMNAGGTVNPTAIRGNVLGLNYYTDANMVSTSIDESAFIIEPRSIEIFESPALTLATNVPTTGEIEISLYGYIAAQAVFAGGLRRFNLT
jgi:HK97 family phage prohead protease